MNRAQFTSRYAAAFRSFLADPREPSLRVAYELGRQAVTADLSLLDIVAAHQDVIRAALASGATDLDRLATASGDFLIESLAPFEMVQRGLPEARRAAANERRRSRMLRRLSELLADESLALGDVDSMQEILQLVAEHGRELAGARTATITLTREGLRWAGDTSATARAADDSVDAADTAAAATPGGPTPMFEPIALRVPLLTLDGSPLGWIEVRESDHGRFTEADEAVLTQVAQMAAATIERVLAY